MNELNELNISERPRFSNTRSSVDIIYSSIFLDVQLQMG